ncbi:MAG: aspartate aminotransferase family protein [Gammaproteobacteria bacterium]|nr:aspartate aminotransferase family protein [Gammaproteobacteria bacterium]
MNDRSPFELEKESVEALSIALERLEAGFKSLPDLSGAANSGPFWNVLEETAERLQDNFPYFHPLYAGQMLKPPHPLARAAYALAMWINPNNHALDGGRASSQMEKEAVAEIAAMFGWDEHLGHLCGGGTMANLEALWIASQRQPGKVVLASSQAHYTHERISKVLGIKFESVACDKQGRLDIHALEARLERGDAGTVVATMGTTAIGAVDPLPQIIALRDRFGFNLHADAAYGGYFRLASNLCAEAQTAFDALNNVDSIVIDPHKHGLQPYGCGCVIFKDPAVGRHYQHDSPYTYFSSDELHLGEISLECSRPGAAAVALWATQRQFPLVTGGAFAKMLESARAATLKFHEALASDSRFLPALVPQLDIVVWIPIASAASKASALSREIFKAAADLDLHLAVAELPVQFFDLDSAGIEADADTVSCLRSVLMKPEHLEWIDEIYSRLGDAHAAVTQ